MENNKLVFFVAICLAAISLLSPFQAHSKQQNKFSHLYLFEKNQRNWTIIPRGAWGMMKFNLSGPTFDFVFNGHQLKPHTGYTLLYYPDPWPGNGLICLGKGITNRGGNIHIDGSVNLNANLPIPCDLNSPVGAKIWLVKTKDVDCLRKKMIGWHPRDYLFEEKLIRYQDTDFLPNYSGTYCLLISNGSCTGTDVTINQTGDTITFTIADLPGYIGTGSVSGNTLTMTGEVPDRGDLTIVITFSCDGETFSGTYVLGDEHGTVTGSRNACVNPFPEGIPVCSLPVPADTLSLVTGGQQFNSVSGGIVHTGLDFEFGTPLPTIIAPCDGVIQSINRHAISDAGYIIFDVEIRYNRDWSTFIAFEPFSPDPAIADVQEGLIDVRKCQTVRKGDVLGRLFVPSPITEYPHIHWQMYQNDADHTPVCPRDFLSIAEQFVLDTLYGGLTGPSGVLSPVCISGD